MYTRVPPPTPPPPPTHTHTLLSTIHHHHRHYLTSHHQTFDATLLVSPLLWGVRVAVHFAWLGASPPNKGDRDRFAFSKNVEAFLRAQIHDSFGWDESGDSFARLAARACCTDDARGQIAGVCALEFLGHIQGELSITSLAHRAAMEAASCSGTGALFAIRASAEISGAPGATARTGHT